MSLSETARGIDGTQHSGAREELEKVRLGNEELKDVLLFKYLGLLQSGGGETLIPVNHRIEIAWSRYTNFRRILTSPGLPRSLRLRLLKGVRNVVVTVRMRILETYNSCAAENSTSTVSTMLSRITGRSIAEEDRTPSANILMNKRDRRWSWLGQILHMDEDRFVRKVLLNCDKPEKESLYGHSQPKLRESYRNCTR